MQFKCNVRKMGGSTYLLLPREITDYLQLEEGEATAIVEEKDGKHGKYAQFWKREKEQQDESDPELLEGVDMDGDLDSELTEAAREEAKKTKKKI